MSLCDSCLWQHENKEETNAEVDTLWQFPYQQYEDVKVMGAALRDDYERVRARYVDDPDRYWNRHNADGYTFTQWTIYYVSKKNYTYRTIRPFVERLFHALSWMPFFGSLLALGRRDDCRHHTLHHFFFWMESGMTFYQKRLYRHLVNWLNRRRLSHLLFVCDANGHHVIDYFHQVHLPHQVFQTCRQLTRAYKQTERAWFAEMNVLPRCEQCRDWLRPYEHLLDSADEVNAWLDEHPEWSERVLEMIQQREACNRLYQEHTSKERESDQDSVQRHDFVLDVYRTLFEWEPMDLTHMSSFSSPISSSSSTTTSSSITTTSSSITSSSSSSSSTSTSSVSS